MLPIFVAIVFSILFTYLLFMLSKRRTSKLAPKASGWWPILGHLHLFAHPKQPPHETLARMADKSGPVFRIQIGARQVLVVNSWESAKQCFTANDKAFSNRPKAIAIEIFGYNYAMFGFSPYGEYWRQLRKIVSYELLSNQQVDKLKYVMEEEVRQAIRDLYMKSANNNRVLLEFQGWVRDVTLNLILKIIAGKRCPSEWENVMGEALNFLSNNFAISDVIPWLRWLDIGGSERKMKSIAKVIDSIMSEWLEEHNKKINKSNQDEDFMDVLLSILKDHPQLVKATYDVDTIIKATCLALILGSSESTSMVIVSALSLMLNERKVIERAKNEIDTVVGRDRIVNESDVKKLVYLNAIVKETLRLYPPSPISPPRESIEDCVVDGYHIPKGTHLFVNLWKIQRDPRIWEDALEFQPERFLTKHKEIDVKGHDYMLLPFGSGRRICSGVSLSLQVISLTLAHVLQAFEIETTTGELIEMRGGSTPIQVVLTPRLSPHLY